MQKELGTIVITKSISAQWHRGTDYFLNRSFITMNLTQVLARATFVVGDKRQGMDSARNYSLSVL